MAFAKAFVAKLLRDFSSRETARKVLDAAFDKSLRVVKQSLEEYSSPDFRGSHDETEAIQRLNLHTAMTNLKHVLWLVERMIELRLADTAVKAWSEQSFLTADLRRAFLDDLWRAFFPGLPSVVLRCTCLLANAVATGNVLAATQVCKITTDMQQSDEGTEMRETAPDNRFTKYYIRRRRSSGEESSSLHSLHGACMDDQQAAW